MSSTTGFTLRAPSIHSLSEYPALSVGVIIFTFLLLILNLITSNGAGNRLSLYLKAPFRFDLNRLSFYSMFHERFLHWLFNVTALFPVMSMFERNHGTVYTGVTLNLFTVVAGIQYCLLGLVLYPNTHVIGISGIVFLFISFFAYKEHQHKPILYQFRVSANEYRVPTIASPFVLLVVSKILFVNSSFFIHLAGISTGFAYALGYLRILYPPLKVILFIENKAYRAIKLLDGIVTFYPESEAIETRGVSYNPILSSDIEAAEVA